MRPLNIPATALSDLIAGAHKQSTRVLELGRIHPLKGGPLMGRPWAAVVAPLAAIALVMLPGRALAHPLPVLPTWPAAPPGPEPASAPPPAATATPDADKKPDAPAPQPVARPAVQPSL